jgi:hypothetical protein
MIQLQKFGCFQNAHIIEIKSNQSTQIIILIGDNHYNESHFDVFIYDLIHKSNVSIDFLVELWYKDKFHDKLEFPSKDRVDNIMHLRHAFSKFIPFKQNKIFHQKDFIKNQKQINDYFQNIIKPYKGKLKIWFIDYRLFNIYQIFGLLKINHYFNTFETQYQPFLTINFQFHDDDELNEIILKKNLLKSKKINSFLIENIEFFYMTIKTLYIIYKKIYFLLIGFEIISDKFYFDKSDLNPIKKQDISNKIYNLLIDIPTLIFDYNKIYFEKNIISIFSALEVNNIITEILGRFCIYCYLKNDLNTYTDIWYELIESLRDIKENDKSLRIYDYFNQLPENLQNLIIEIILNYSPDDIFTNMFFLDIYLIHRLFFIIEKNQNKYIPIFIGDSHANIILNIFKHFQINNESFSLNRKIFQVQNINNFFDTENIMIPQLNLRSHIDKTPYMIQYQRRENLKKSKCLIL